jgi:hypothetical protein
MHSPSSFPSLPPFLPFLLLVFLGKNLQNCNLYWMGRLPHTPLGSEGGREGRRKAGGREGEEGDA